MAWFNGRPFLNMAPLVIRRPSRHLSYISLYVPFLWSLSVSTSELNCVTFQPEKSWEDFIESQLRPMVYLLQSTIMHGFTLDGSRGVYTLAESAEIKFWYTRILLHCRMIILSLHEEIPSEFNDWGMPAIPAACLPGESVALFKRCTRSASPSASPAPITSNAPYLGTSYSPSFCAHAKLESFANPDWTTPHMIDADHVAKDDGSTDPAVKIDWGRALRSVGFSRQRDGYRPLL
ncbi:hypothetical protein B0H19DRAFT_1267808 [Mycena capillaripes]|nr:hypothetical protein B0H19DRAFT_1267808 [Mycena capillaripes]